MDFQGGLIVLIIFVSLFAIWLIFYFIPVGLWFSALVSGVRISLLQLILMRWRKVPPSTIVSSMIESTKAGLSLDPNELEAHYLAGGNVTSVVHALVSAQKANIMLDFKMATAIDLAGRDVFEAGEPQGHQHPARSGRRQGRHPADRQGPRYGARQYQTAGRRRR